MTNSHFLILCCVLFCMACAGDKHGNTEHNSPGPEDRSASDALADLQMGTDHPNRFFSTFAGAQQACIYPDTVLTIDHDQLHEALLVFAERNCSKMSKDERERCALDASSLKAFYQLSICSDIETHRWDELRTGTWVLAGVGGQRDVVIIW